MSELTIYRPLAGSEAATEPWPPVADECMKQPALPAGPTEASSDPRPVVGKIIDLDTFPITLSKFTPRKPDRVIEKCIEI